MQKKGFTLIELMIVVAIIAIIAAIAIPNILRARISANEGAVIGNLRSLATAQQTFQSNAAADQNGNGTGEYGVFNELTGTASIRSANNNYLPPADPGYIPIALATDGQFAGAGISKKSGYFFRIYLPGIVSDSDAGNSNSEAVFTTDEAITKQENRWISYSWPASFRASGIRAFVVDQNAQVLVENNVDASDNPFFEAFTGPAFNSALTSGNAIEWSSLAINTIPQANSAFRWRPIN